MLHTQGTGTQILHSLTLCSRGQAVCILRVDFTTAQNYFALRGPAHTVSVPKCFFSRFPADSLIQNEFAGHVSTFVLRGCAFCSFRGETKRPRLKSSACSASLHRHSSRGKLDQRNKSVITSKFG